MRLQPLIYSAFLMMLVVTGCVSKSAPVPNTQNQHPIQNSTTHPSMAMQTDSIANDSINRELITRRLLRRGNIGQITTQPGKIVVLVCIDQTGKVISATFDSAASSSSHRRFARQAEDCAKQYVFEEDITAPPEQCGKLTFVYKRE